jgi:hypothetical protein
MRRELIAAGVAALALFVVTAGASRAQVVSTPIATPAPIPTPSPLSSMQTFSCSCSSPGQPVQWAGRLTASSYFQASQAAKGACLGYLTSKPIPGLVAQQTNNFTSALGSLAVTTTGTCANCACN